MTVGPSSQRRVILELPCPPEQVAVATHIRGTVLATSLRYVNELGLGERYFEILPASAHPVIEALIPSEWISLELAHAHYGVLEQLVTEPASQRAAGRFVAERVQNSYAGTVLRGLSAAGALSPFAVLNRVQMFWDRLVQGGAAEVTATGPKDAVVSCHGMPLCCYGYFRNGWMGMFESTLGLLARAVFVNPVPGRTSDTVLTMRISWA